MPLVEIRPPSNHKYTNIHSRVRGEQHGAHSYPSISNVSQKHSAPSQSDHHFHRNFDITTTSITLVLSPSPSPPPPPTPNKIQRAQCFPPSPSLIFTNSHFPPKPSIHRKSVLDFLPHHRCTIPPPLISRPPCLTLHGNVYFTPHALQDWPRCFPN